MQPSSKRTKRERHVPQTKATHVYWSRRADGSKVFEVRHPVNANGQRLYEVVGTRLDAAKARAHEIYGSQTAGVTAVGLTLADVVEHWKKSRQLRPRSAESFDGILRRHILVRFGRTRVRDIGKNEIATWLAGLRRQDGREGPLASGTKRLILATLQLVLSHAVEMGALGAVPKLDRKRTPKAGEARRRVLTRDEETRLLAYCAPFQWLAPIITVTLHQALRMGETLGMQWEDVDFATGKLHVRHALGRDGTLGPPKGGRVGVIDLTPVAREALLELRMDSAGTGFVFRNKLGGPRQLRDVGRAFEKARSRAALPVTDDGPVVFHSLRHTGISRLANHPAIPLVHVRDFARHSDLSVTQGYVHKIEDAAVTAAIAEALSG
jgi:integrase